MLKRFFDFVLPALLGLVTLQFLFFITPVLAQESEVFGGVLSAFGIEEAGTAGTIALFVLVARFFAKIIPDSTGGILGMIRMGLKFLGAYTPNKVNPSDSVSPAPN